MCSSAGALRLLCAGLQHLQVVLLFVLLGDGVVFVLLQCVSRRLAFVPALCGSCVSFCCVQVQVQKREEGKKIITKKKNHTKTSSHLRAAGSMWIVACSLSPHRSSVEGAEAKAQVKGWQIPHTNHHRVDCMRRERKRDFQSRIVRTSFSSVETDFGFLQFGDVQSQPRPGRTRIG